MSVSIFSTAFVWNSFYPKKKWARYDQNVHWSSCKVPVILVRFLMKLGFSWQIFEKYSNIKFHENPTSGSRVVPCGQTDGRKDMTKLVVAFRNIANAPKNNSTFSVTVRFSRYLAINYGPVALYLEQYTVEPRFTNASLHEQIGSRTHFPKKKSRVTNGASSNEHASRQQRLATSWEYRRESVSCCVTFAQYTLLLEFAVPSLEFHCILWLF
jgi:hypothetical protein